jgi:membrane peptidoglycan carboxypeptidase
MALIQTLDPEVFLEQMEAFGLFSTPDFSLRTIAPGEKPDPAVIESKPMSALEIQATPLQMALVAASITNDGLLPSPRLRNTYLAEDGKWTPFREGVLPVRVVESGAMARLRASLTGNDRAFWFQSGHALTRDGKILTWYIGGTTEDWVATPLAIAVAIESNAPELAQTIGSSLLSLFATE